MMMNYYGLYMLLQWFYGVCDQNKALKRDFQPLFKKSKMAARTRRNYNVLYIRTFSNFQ